MGDASMIYAFSPNMHPVGKVVFHLTGEAHDIPNPVPWELRSLEPATWMRRDHAELLGRLCKRCEASGG